MRTLVLAIALSAVGCGGDSPTSPSGQTEQFTWTVNGQSYSSSSNGREALRGSGSSTISIVGANCSSASFISMLVKNPAVGTFPVSQDVSLRWTPDARSSTNQDNFDAPGNGGLNIGTGSGTVTITSLTDSWISGTFNVVAVPFFNNQDKTQKTIVGSFELPFRDSTIC